jgi:hypothetical protein
MKHIIILALLSIVLVMGCAPKAEKATLKEGTAAFDLAKELSAVIPALAPDKGTVVVEAKGIVITAAEVIQAIQDNRGAQTAQLKGVDAGQLKNIIEQGAIQLAERKLLLAAAAKAKAVVTAEEFENAMQAQYAQAGGEPAFLEALKGMGISIDHVKKSVRESLIINKYLEGIVAAGAKVTEDEIKRAYQEETTADKTASVRHILLLTQGKTEPEKAEARKKIESLLALIFL